MPAPSVPVQLNGYRSPVDATVQALVRLAAVAFGFLAMLPYPAVPVGSSTGLQAGHLFAAAALVPLLLAPKFRLWMSFWPLLVAPLVLSLVRLGFAGDGDFSIGVKACISIAASMAAVVAAQLLAVRAPLPMLTGIAAAAILHVFVGLLQLRGFAGGELPLLSLYVNPSFLSVQENADTIVRWVRRPFGLFPEPSAMAASLAPWVVIWGAILSGQVYLRQYPSRAQRLLFAGAAAGSVLLIIFSRSGHTVFTLLAVFGLAMGWLRRARAGPGSYALMLLMFAVLIPGLIYLASSSLGARMSKMSSLQNESWSMRWASIEHGFGLLFDGDALTVLFGIGTGQLSTLMSQTAGVNAVWSLLFTYVIETGFVGALVALVIGWELFTVWRRVRDRFVFALVAFVWVAGIAVTTSYPALLSIWMVLGWLSVWPEVADAE